MAVRYTREHIKIRRSLAHSCIATPHISARCRANSIFVQGRFSKIIYVLFCELMQMFSTDAFRCSLPRMAFYSYLRMLRTHIGMEAMQGWGTVSSWRPATGSRFGANHHFLPANHMTHTPVLASVRAQMPIEGLTAGRIFDSALPIKRTDGSLKSNTQTHSGWTSAAK